jgi:hypothetical protein
LWQEVPHPALIRSEVDDGYPKVRRRFTKTWREYQAKWRLGWEQFAAFNSFVETDCGAGAIPFTMPHPMTGVTILVRWKEPPTTMADTGSKPVFEISGNLEEMFS